MIRGTRTLALAALVAMATETIGVSAEQAAAASR